MKNYYYYDDNGNKRIVICDLAMKKEMYKDSTTLPYRLEKRECEIAIERYEEKIAVLENRLIVFNRWEKIENLKVAIEANQEKIRRIEEKQDEYLLDNTYLEVNEETYEKKLKEMRIYNYINLEERKDIEL